MARSDFDELLAILELETTGRDVFLGRHPRKNPIRTFGGQLMAQAFVAASRTLSHPLPPSALSVHFITGGDPARDIEFTVVRLRDERRFANRRVDATQDGTLLATALVSYLAGGAGLEHNFEMPQVPQPHGLPSIDALLVGYEKVVPLFVEAMRPIDESNAAKDGDASFIGSTPRREGSVTRPRRKPAPRMGGESISPPGPGARGEGRGVRARPGPAAARDRAPRPDCGA